MPHEVESGATNGHGLPVAPSMSGALKSAMVPVRIQPVGGRVVFISAVAAVPVTGERTAFLLTPHYTNQPMAQATVPTGDLTGRNQAAQRSPS